jgi:hypothetical protein
MKQDKNNPLLIIFIFMSILQFRSLNLPVVQGATEATSGLVCRTAGASSDPQIVAWPGSFHGDYL